MKFVLVGSGSKGNASLICSGHTLIQVDMGVPLNRIKEALRSLCKEESDIAALLITHEHSDHVSTLPLYHERIKVYCSEGTLKEEPHAVINPFEPFQIGDFEILPFSVSHDAANPIGFIIKDATSKLGYVTDTGYLPDDDIPLLQDCDYYVFESNHDYKMLLHSDRPAILKKRIHSDVGHLSNVDSATYMSELIGPHTKQIYLAHLSEECNTPELALETYQKTFKKKRIDASHIEIIPAKQWESVSGGEK
jgi:phosphoribosyl 1,2-cyclic phosphodiesterase